MKNHLPSCLTAVSLKTTYTTLAAVLCLTVLLAFPATAQQASAEKPADLAALRASSSPAEKKLSFNLLLISREARHADLGALAASMDSSAINADGTVNVQITAYLSPSLMASPVMAGIVRTNGAVSAVDYAGDRMDLRLTKSQLLDLAANPNVLSIREAGRVPSMANMSAANHLPSIAAR